MSGEINAQGSIELLDQVEITHERDGDIIEGYVSPEFINQEDVPVDHVHVRELASSIEKQSTKHERTGQLSPILLGAIPGEDRFRIIDGFHRTAAIATLGEGQVYATIKKDATIEDVIDLRITAAKSHQKVRFSRIVEWIEEAWEKTPWSENISASSAFTMEMLESSGRGLRLSEEEVSEAKEWVRDKCERWDITVNNIDKYLRIAKKADPSLVARVRDRTGGSKLDDITTAHLSQIVRLLPNVHDLQNVVADTAVKNMLTVAQTNSLALAVSRAKSYEAVDRYVDNKVWEGMGSASSALRQKRYHSIEGDNQSQDYLNVLQTKFFDDQVAIAELLIENAIMTGLYRPKLDESSPALMELTIRLGLDEHIESAEQSQEELDEIVASSTEPEEWDPAKINGVAERALALHTFLAGIATRQYRIDINTAEDLASESTIALLSAINKDRVSPEIEGADLHKLMARIMVNRCLNELRKVNISHGGAIRSTVSLAQPIGENGDMELGDTIGENDSNLDSLTDVTENPDFIKTMLPFLSERERRATMLRGVFGLDLDEAAAVLGTNIGTVKALLQRLRNKAVKLSEEIRLESIDV